MSWLDVLHNLTQNVGRGALDVFTLGGNELGHKFGGSGYRNFMSPVETGMGANFEAGAVGGSGMMGAHGLGMMGSGGGTAYMPSSAPNMGMAGSTLGPGGMSSPLNPMSAGGASAGAGGSGRFLQALQMMRGMGGQQQEQQGGPQQNALDQIYQMYPQLRPHIGRY